MRRLIALVLFVAFAACSAGSDDEKVVKAARSWQATVILAAQGLEERTITPRVAGQVAHAALEELEKKEKDARSAAVRAECERAVSAARSLLAASRRR